MAPYKRVFLISTIIVLFSALIGCQQHDLKSAQKSTPFLYKSATELTASIRNGEITSLDLLNLYLDRIERYNDDINAVVALDIEAARARAAEADKALARGENRGPLHGLPMTVKDVFEVLGMPATSGDPKLKDYIPQRNAIGIQIIGGRLEDRTTIAFARGLSELVGGFVAPPGYGGEQ